MFVECLHFLCLNFVLGFSVFKFQSKEPMLDFFAIFLRSSVWALFFSIQLCLNILFVSRYQESYLILAQDKALDLQDNRTQHRLKVPH